jgi:hypothetical protein
MGDHGLNSNNRLVAVNNGKGQKGDFYHFSSSNSIHSFVAFGDNQANAVKGNNFIAPTFDKIKFSSTIAWLKVQLFVGAGQIRSIVNLLNTQAAQAGGWKEKRAMEYGQRPLMIPPEATRVAIGAQLDPNTELSPTWELAVVELSEKFPMTAIARAEGGYVDTINGAASAWTPTNAYFVELGPQTLGIMRPANRQFVSRWVEFSKKNQSVELSDYLKAAADLAGPSTQVVLAADLAGIPQPHKLRESLTESQALGGDEAKVNQLAPLIGSIRGITVTLSVATKIGGKVQIDFDQDVKPLGMLAKPLVLEALDRFDCHIEELDKWSFSLQDKAIVMTGELSNEGLRRVGSLLEVPSTKFSDLKDVEPVKAGTPDYVKTSQAYYKSVTSLIDGLRSTLKDERDNHAVWMERYGRKVDALPILNVDEELLAWGAKVAETFRAMSVAEKSANVRAGVRKSEVYSGYSYSGYDAYYTSGLHAKTQVQRQEKAVATQMRFDSAKELEDATADIRRAMTAKYGVEF